MLIELKYLTIGVDNINDFSHQHLFKKEPFIFGSIRQKCCF